jgi:c-di-AMP phosphodiesterase-like protein
MIDQAPQAQVGPRTLNHRPDTSEFSPRPAFLKSWHILIITAIFVMLINISATMYDKMAAVIAATSFCVISSTLIYMLQQKMLSERTSSEFMSLVLSEAMRSNTILSIIVDKEGSIFYLDPRYQRNFPEAKSYHNLDNIMNILTIKHPEQREILRSLVTVSPYKLDFKLKRKLNSVMGIEDIDLQLSIYPLQRPAGFSHIAISHKETAPPAFIKEPDFQL